MRQICFFFLYNIYIHITSPFEINKKTNIPSVAPTNDEWYILNLNSKPKKKYSFNTDNSKMYVPIV